MRKNIFTVCARFVFAALFSVLFVSCGDIMGYGVLLWNVPEHGLRDGDIVPVYIRSNISGMYVIGVPDGEKSEIPLWQLTEPVSKKKSGEAAARYLECAHRYASVKLDGLPCRAEPVNTSRQVYRLRRGEVIKLLYKGEGQAVMAGKNALEGDWYRILASDGTQGWCFSYNLNIFETDADGNRIGGEEAADETVTDSTFDYIAGKNWYPDYFRTLIDSGNMDLSRLHSSYRFAVDTANKKVYLNLTDIHESWNYNGFTVSGSKEYSLDGIPVTIYYRNSSFIVVRYTGANGKPEDLNFALIDENIDEIVAKEKKRRSVEYASVVASGPEFSSSSYGKLTFSADGTFRWTKFRLLVPSVISSGAKEAGTVSVKYAVPRNLRANYDGVLTFRFDGTQSDVNFLYKKEHDGIRLEDASGAVINGNLVTGRGSSPLVLYFKK